MGKSRPSVQKRAKERKRFQKRMMKEMRKAKREAQKAEEEEEEPDVKGDPDLAGIVPGPQNNTSTASHLDRLDPEDLVP